MERESKNTEEKKRKQKCRFCHGAGEKAELAGDKKGGKTLVRRKKEGENGVTAYLCCL